MEFIMSEQELNKIKETSQTEGFNKAESLLQKVLNGERNLRVVTENGFVTQKSEPVKWGAWFELIQRLDSGKKTQELILEEK